MKLIVLFFQIVTGFPEVVERFLDLIRHLIQGVGKITNGIKIQSVNNIFISHLHGDHFFGLIGLLSTMSLMGRTTDINLFAPEPLKEIINIQLKASQTWLQYKLNFKSLNFSESEILINVKGLEVTSFPVRHSINCCGFVFKEAPKPRKINKVLVEDYNVPIEWMKRLTEGQDYVSETGEIIANKKLTLNPEPIKSYAYCADTLYSENIIESIKNVDLLYHEATFMHDLTDRANKTKHSTAQQAGSIAKQANVKQLLIGHFSGRYKDLTVLLDEAKKQFLNTLIAEQNLTYKI